MHGVNGIHAAFDVENLLAAKIRKEFNYLALCSRN